MLFIALCFSDAGVYEPAIEAYKRILEVEPSDSRVHLNMGLLYEALGEREKALESFDMAVAYDRENYYAFSNRADCYFKMHELDMAVSDAERALSIKSNGREAASLLAVIYSLTNDTENAEKYYHQAVAAGALPEDIKAAVEMYKRDSEDSDAEEQS